MAEKIVSMDVNLSRLDEKVSRMRYKMKKYDFAGILKRLELVESVLDLPLMNVIASEVKKLKK